MTVKQKNGKISKKRDFTEINKYFTDNSFDLGDKIGSNRVIFFFLGKMDVTLANLYLYTFNI